MDQHCSARPTCSTWPDTASGLELFTQSTCSFLVDWWAAIAHNRHTTLTIWWHLPKEYTCFPNVLSVYFQPLKSATGHFKYMYSIMGPLGIFWWSNENNLRIHSCVYVHMIQAINKYLLCVYSYRDASLYHFYTYPPPSDFYFRGTKTHTYINYCPSCDINSSLSMFVVLLHVCLVVFALSFLSHLLCHFCTPYSYLFLYRFIWSNLHHCINSTIMHKVYIISAPL